MAKEMNLSLYEIRSILNDEIFKDVVKYKGIAAIFLKLTIPELKELDFYTIMSSIVDRTKREEHLTFQQLATSEIDLTKTEEGTGKEKNIRHDAIFDIVLPGQERIVIVLQPELLATVNFEMQRKVLKSELGYSVVSRGTYYTASLLRNTVPAGDSKYANIHKVYSIWFCDGYLHLDTLGHEELNQVFIHRFHMVRYYPEELPDTAIHIKEDGADLMETIFVELPKLKKYGDSILAETVTTLFYDTQSFPKKITKLMPELDLRQVKEVEKMVDYAALIQEREAEMREIITEEVTERVTEEVTERVTEEVTERVTEEVTERVTEEVTERVTEEVTERVTEEVTAQVTKQLVTEFQEKETELEKLKKELAEMTKEMARLKAAAN